jgi:MYXO-CTERM domain-containing protein
MRRIILGVCAVGALVGCNDDRQSPRLGHTEQALSTGLVISGIYGASGAASYKNDFVEIFNRGPTPISLTGMTIQYSRPDYRTWDLAANKIALTGTIPAGGYYLVKLSANSSGLADLPTPDLTGTTVVSSGGALFALVSDSTTLDCGPPPPITLGDGGPGADPDTMSMPTPCTSSSIIDFVGYGVGTASPKPAPVWEGSGAAPTASMLSIIRRKGLGCIETDDNAADFELVPVATTPAFNSSSPLNTCGRDDAAVDAADTSVDDTAAADTALVDTAAPDTALPDTAPPDTGPADTGPADTGPMTTDVAADVVAETIAEDTGTAVDSAPQDTGTIAVDTGTIQDTGTVPVDEVLEDDGCGCRLPGSSGESRNTASAFGIAAIAALVAARRRRR